MFTNKKHVFFDKYTSFIYPHAVLTKFGFLHLTPCWATAAALKYLGMFVYKYVHFGSAQKVEVSLVSAKVKP